MHKGAGMAKEDEVEEGNLTCPQCGYEIPLTEALHSQVEEELRKQFEMEFAKKEKTLQARVDEIAGRERLLADQRTALDEEVARKLQEEKKKLEEKVRRQAGEEIELTMRDLQGQLKEKADKLKEMRQQELEMARQLDEEKKKLGEQARESVEKEFKLKESEYEQTIMGMRNTIEELKRQSEQGSQQKQGEALEQVVEEELKACFMQDNFEPVGTGRRGADLSQQVCDGTGQICGTIIWEAKNTKVWQDAWIDKLKQDQREAGADVAVIVTIAMPRDIKGFGNYQGVWVTDYSSYLGLTTALRSGIIEVSHARASAVGKSEKMEILYDYLSGPGFRRKVEAIVEAFITMRAELDQEKRAVTRMWSKREKQIQRVVDNTAAMYGEMQGIIGALPEIESLELKVLEAGEEEELDGEEALVEEL
jgi:hypothetical protein